MAAAHEPGMRQRRIRGDIALPARKVIHVILDNYSRHTRPKVLRWLARDPRFVFHYTPTSGSWLDAVETFFSALTRRRLKRGSFRSIVDLQAATTATSPSPSRPQAVHLDQDAGEDPRQTASSECASPLTYEPCHGGDGARTWAPSLSTGEFRMS
jgi:DDE superfamily endonuclease